MALKVVNQKKKIEEVVVVPTSKILVAALSGNMLEDARGAYQSFQSSWYGFAKSVKAIKDASAWTAHGYDDLSSLCRVEFAGIPFPTIVKFIRVVDEFGQALESRLSKGVASLPAYDALYELAVNEKNMPKAEAARIRKLIVEGKMSVREVREVVRSLVDKGETKHSPGREAKKVKRQEELAAEVSIQKAFEVIGADVDVEVDVDEQMKSSVDKDAKAITKLLDSVKSQVSSVTSSAKSSSGSLVDLAIAIEEAVAVFNEYLDKIEELSANEEE